MALRSRTALALGVYGLMVGGFVVAGVVASQGGSLVLDSVESLALMPIPVVFGTVGLLLALRVPENRVGWVFLVGGTLFSLYIASYAYFFWGVVTGWPAVGLIGLLSYVLYMPAILSLTALPLLLFPTGHVPSDRWRWVLRALVLFVALNAVALVISPQLPSDTLGSRNPDEIAVGSVSIEAGQRVILVANQLGVENLPDWVDALNPVFLALLAVSFLGPAASMVYRLTRAQGEERLQIKWLGLSALIAGLGLGSFYVIQSLIPEAALLDSLLGVGLVGLLGIPVAAGVAITRYRLYEIDRLISRTISYTVIVGLLGLLFAGGVVWLPTALGLNDSPLLVAATTLLVAALFSPLRTRVQNKVDRRFNRSNYLSAQVAEQFNVELQTADDLDEILGIWLETVSESLAPEAAAIWLANPPNSDDPATA